MDWQSLQTNSENVVVCPVTGDHRTGSSQIRVVNIVDSAWERCFHWGNLVATHHSGNYLAYALTGTVLHLLSSFNCCHFIS